MASSPSLRADQSKKDAVAYRLIYSRDLQPLVSGAEVSEMVEGVPGDHAANIPPCTIRWKFETKVRRTRSRCKDVLLKQILETCQEYQLEPLSISNPVVHEAGQYLDIRFASGNDFLKAWEVQPSLDIPATQLTIVGRGPKLGLDMIGLEIKTLPATIKLPTVIDQLSLDARLQEAGEVIDVWAVDSVLAKRFTGRVLVLFKIKSVAGEPSIAAKTKIPGFLVMGKTAYTIKFAGRPGWCKYCCHDTEATFHSIHSCPKSQCHICGRLDHTAAEHDIARGTRPGKVRSDDVVDPAEDVSQEADAQMHIAGQTTEPAQTAAERSAVAKEKAKVKRKKQKRRTAAAAETTESASPGLEVDATRTPVKAKAVSTAGSLQLSEDPVRTEEAGQASNIAKDPKTLNQQASPSEQRSRRPQHQPRHQQRQPETLPAKQLRYIKAMERRLLQMCLDEESADMSTMARSYGVIALSSDEDDERF